MAGTYLEDVSGKTFMDLVDNEDFQADLVRFFSGGRYNYSIEEMRDRGAEGLANDFVRHMRYQSMNEATAAKDLFFVKSDDTSDTARTAFGNLMEAYDASDGGGTGVLEGVWDYMSGFATSPSTLFTVGTMGLGVGSKVAMRGASMATQMAIRNEVLKAMSRGATREAAEAAVRRQVAAGAVQGVTTRQAGRVMTGSALTEAARSVATTGVVEGTLGAAQSLAEHEARAGSIEGYTYTMGDVAQDAAISAVVGGGLGGLAGGLDARTRNQVFTNLLELGQRQQAAATAARAASNQTLSSVSPDVAGAAVDRASAVLERLDPEMVMKGDAIRELVLTNGEATTMLSPRGFSTDTVRGIAAATIDLTERLNIRPNERISSAVARGIDAGQITTDSLREIGQQFGLTSEQLSYVWLSDLSEAGRTLGEAGRLSQAVRGAREAISGLKGRGVATPDERTVQAVADAVKNNRVSPVWAARQLDQASIAMMTTQLGTTTANILGTAFNIGADWSDQMWRGFYRSLKGDFRGAGASFRGSFDMIRGFSATNEDVKVLQYLVAQNNPDEYARTFHDVIRSDEVVGNESSMLLRMARRLNFVNSAVDGVYKRGIFYGSLNRQLRDLNDPALGTNVSEFLARNNDFDALPEGVFDRAVYDARDLTMQKSYYNDESWFGRLANTAEEVNRNVPFLMSQGVGIPFPRYVANHLERIADYTPIGIGSAALDAADAKLYGTGAFSDAFKTGEDRIVRQMTGLSIMGLGATLYMTGSSPDYETLILPGQGEESGGVDLKRSLGPWMAHMYVGELIGRYLSGDPITKSLDEMGRDALDIGLGTTDLGFQGGLLGDILGYYENPSPTTADAVSKSLGNFVSTFTYPAAVARDIVGQFDPRSAPTPYTRNRQRGGSEEVYDTGNFFTYLVRNEQFAGQASRFLPDLKFFSYASNQSRAPGSQAEIGGYDLPYHSPFNPAPLNTPNPISRQFGMQEQARPTQIQREMTRLQMDEMNYNPRVDNPVVDYMMRRVLSQNLPEAFVTWRDNQELQMFGGLKYSELEPDQQKAALEGFISATYSEVRTNVESYLDSVLNSPKVEERRMAAGYVRNMYFLYDRNEENRNKLSLATRELTDGRYSDPAEYFLDSESVEEELSKRMAVMEFAEGIGGITGTGLIEPN